jgi:cytochrome c
MIREAVAAFAAAFLLVAGPVCAADEQRTTPEQAETMVHNAIAHYKKVGREKALADFADKHGTWIHGDAYVNVYDLEGKCLAHINEKTIGKNMIDLRDVDGKYLIRERIERAQAEKNGWQQYKFYNPATKKVEPKDMFFERYEDVVFAAGAYKPPK